MMKFLARKHSGRKRSTRGGRSDRDGSWRAGSDDDSGRGGRRLLRGGASVSLVLASLLGGVALVVAAMRNVHLRIELTRSTDRLPAVGERRERGDGAARTESRRGGQLTSDLAGAASRRSAPPGGG